MTPYFDDGQVTIYCGDAREILPSLAPTSIDLIVTDPPYLREFLPLYGVLAVEAARITTPGAFTYAYVGAEWLPEVLALMIPHLTWYWLHNLGHGGAQPRLWHKRLMVGSKPVLGFTNGKVDPRSLRWTGSDVWEQPRSKEFHEWGQGLVFPRKAIWSRTHAGDLVLDPFMGGGTTIRAAVDMGRRVIGIELDETHCATAVRRLAQLVLPLEVS